MDPQKYLTAYHSKNHLASFSIIFESLVSRNFVLFIFKNLRGIEKLFFKQVFASWWRHIRYKCKDISMHSWRQHELLHQDFALKLFHVFEMRLSYVLTLSFCPNFMQTTLPVEEITKTLATKGYDVMTSDDAGRFVCNYVYYHSLRFAEQNGNKSLFVHVPLFFTINEETQMQFAASLLEVLANVSNTQLM